MLKLTLHVKPLSVNEAYKGRHFPTPAKRKFEAALRYSLPKVGVPRGPYYRVEYEFYLKNFHLTDGANLEKVLTDCLVKSGIIEDDRFIVDYRIRKFPVPAGAKDAIVLLIEPVALAAAP